MATWTASSDAETPVSLLTQEQKRTRGFSPVFSRVSPTLKVFVLMPSGKTHDKITLITAALAVPVWWWLAPVKDGAGLAIGLAAYLFSGFWLSDDLDTHSIAYKRWGVLRWIWWPYQKLVPHRSWVSHSVGFGPLFRVAYFLVMLWALMRGALWLLTLAHVPVNRDAVLGGFWGLTTDWTAAHPSWAMCALLGLIGGGLAHSVADTVVSWAKRVW